MEAEPSQFGRNRLRDLGLPESEPPKEVAALHSYACSAKERWLNLQKKTFRKLRHMYIVYSYTKYKNIFEKTKGFG